LEVTDLNERRRRRRGFVVQIPAQQLSPASVLQMAKQLHAAYPSSVSAVITGAHLGQVKGEVLTADAMDAHHTFENPDAIHPVVFDGAKLDGAKLSVTLPAKSVVVLKLK
jgi:alpha-L-arabinofuranosidase